MLKKLHIQKYMISKIQVLIALVFCMLGFDTCIVIFPKFYIKFRTCILSPIHYYIAYKLIQNMLKNI